MFGSAASGGVRAVTVTAGVALLVAVAVLAGPAWAATLTVDTAADGEPNTNGECSLREAVINANGDDQSGSSDCLPGGGGDDIVFALEDPSAIITLTSQLPAVTDDAGLTVDGADAGITVSGADRVRVFEVAEGAKLALNGLTVADGNSLSDPGGGILNLGTLRVSNSTLSGNAAANGGGVANARLATLSNTTLSGNSASNSGGGIYNHGQDALLEVSSSTLSGNAAPSGGGIEHSGGSVLLENTIVAGGPSDDDCHRSVDGSVPPITDGGYNLDSDDTCGLMTANHSRPGFDPELDPLLVDNGGPSPTHALLEGSPAVDRGDSFGSSADQRGLPRPTDLGDVGNARGGDGADIGAYEMVKCSGGVVNAAGTIVGTPGDDTGKKVLEGTAGNDTIFGLGGDDTIYGLDGNDEVCSGKGNDKIYGGKGSDILLGGEGKDGLFGGPDGDSVFGLKGDDRLNTRDGVRDLADGGTGKDVCRTDRKDKKVRCR